ncbi:MAG: DUF5054 domain-containing protein, partial [Clostridia bacterium]|nr:DUF5054 domain-containing protein [Clostridia bacterium]
KMTDVPGHTIGIIPIMKKKGVKFLHIGVNPATPLPPVPKVFRWKCGEDEIRVMYQGDYGTAEDFGDFAVYFAHTGDNAGPQSAEDIVSEYKKVREKFPDCYIVAATIDDLAEEVEKMKGLPVFDKEIGDSWIHGAGTDPEKVARYRKVLRELEKYDEIPFDLTDNLLCVPEHTWGVNLNIYFHYDKYYSAEELAKMPAEREKMENSWKEQRAYVERAEKLFGVTPDYPVEMPELKGEETDEEIPLEISWQLFDNSDYERYKKVYMRSFVDWAIWDFTKPGLPDYKGGIYVARVDKACKTGEKTTYRLTFENEIAERYGLPTFFVEKQGSHVTVKWQGKKATRFPQAFWLKFKGYKEDWEINKMDKWLRPEDFSGSPLISAVYEGIRNGEVEIKTYDCALVAPFGRRLLQYNVEDKKQDMYFNLYNNIWNTNFPMWYSDDGRFVFEIETKK